MKELLTALLIAAAVGGGWWGLKYLETNSLLWGRVVRYEFPDGTVGFISESELEEEVQEIEDKSSLPSSSSLPQEVLKPLFEVNGLKLLLADRYLSHLMKIHRISEPTPEEMVKLRKKVALLLSPPKEGGEELTVSERELLKEFQFILFPLDSNDKGCWRFLALKKLSRVLSPYKASLDDVERYYDAISSGKPLPVMDPDTLQEYLTERGKLWDTLEQIETALSHTALRFKDPTLEKAFHSAGKGFLAQ